MKNDELTVRTPLGELVSGSKRIPTTLAFLLLFVATV